MEGAFLRERIRRKAKFLRPCYKLGIFTPFKSSWQLYSHYNDEK
jgi:hypothetical protein